MRVAAAKLSDAQMIDLAAYIGSRPAWTRAEAAALMGGR